MQNINRRKTAITIVLVYFIMVIVLFSTDYIIMHNKTSLSPQIFHLQSVKAATLLLFTGLVLYLIISREIKRSKLLEQQSKENQKKYEEIVRNANSVIVKFDLDGIILFFNEYAEQLFGYKESEIMGSNIFDILIPHNNPNKRPGVVDKNMWMNRIINRIKTEPYGESWNLTKSGKRIFMSWTNKPVFNEIGEITGVISIGIDRTEEKIMHNRLKESEQKFKQIFNSVNDSVLIISPDGKILEQNERVINSLGISRAKLSTLSVKQLFENDLTNLEKLVNQVNKDGEVFFEIEVVTAQNQKIPVEVRANTIMYKGEEAILAVGRTTEHKKQQEQRVLKATIEAEELERSRIAKELHDSVSPILSTAKLYAQSISDSKSPDMQNKILKKVEQTINESINSISEISNKLSPHVLENFGLIEAVKTFAEKISETRGLVIEIDENIEKRLPTDIATVLYRVTTELLYNTLKYANASEVYLQYNLQKNLIFIYKDNGVGFNVEEVFNTNKGMGLFNITTRLKTIGGKIDYQSEINNGVNVNIEIPL